MINIKINGAERALKDADPNWINEQINRRREDGAVICVRVTINCPPLNMALATAGCGSAVVGGRPPSDEEKEIFELWRQRHLDKDDFTGGNLVAFLKQLANRISC